MQRGLDLDLDLNMYRSTEMSMMISLNFFMRRVGQFKSPVGVAIKSEIYSSFHLQIISSI